MELSNSDKISKPINDNNNPNGDINNEIKNASVRN